jgi:hypothetical protein
MGTYLKKFETDSEYNTYVASENFILPNVSLVGGGYNVKYHDIFGGYEYVDLGLPSGLLWAKCNVGAETETDYGDYFTWGASANCTSTAITVDWQNYPYGNGTSDPGATGMTKYNETDGLTTLEPCDDAAHIVMGGKWRMPTYAEYQELLNYTYETTNIYGVILTSTVNGKTIFFPGCGYRDGNSNGGGGNVYYWTSSVDTSRCFYGEMFYKSLKYVQTNMRFRGFSVRAVMQP